MDTEEIMYILDYRLMSLNCKVSQSMFKVLLCLIVVF